MHFVRRRSRSHHIYQEWLTTVRVRFYIILKESGKYLAELLPGLGVYTTTYIGAFYGASDQSGFFQLLQVLEVGLRQAQLIYHISAYAAVYLYQVLQDGNTRGMGYCLLP